MMVTVDWSLLVSILNLEPLIVFPLPCPAGEGRDRLALVGTRCPTTMGNMDPCSKAWECHRPSRSGRDQFFTALWVTVHSVGVMCKLWSTPKGKQWKILNEKWEFHICILFLSKFCAERENTVQGTPAGCPFCFYREGIPRTLPLALLHPERKMKELRVSNFSYCALTTLIHTSLEKKGMRLGSSTKTFFLPLHNDHPTKHFWSLCFLFHLFSAGNLNFPSSPCSLSDVH